MIYISKIKLIRFFVLNLLLVLSSFALAEVHQIVSVTSDKCMGIQKKSSDNGINIHQWQCTGVHNPPNLLWDLRKDPAGSGNFYLVNRQSGKCAGIAEKSDRNGVNIHQWQCSGVHNIKNLLWALVPAGNEGSTRVYNIINAQSKRCMGIAQYSSNNGVNIHQWQCTNVHQPNNLRWYIQRQ